MSKHKFNTPQIMAAAAAAALLVGTGGAQADFRGGGALFGFTNICTQHGWPVGGVSPVRVRYAASEDNQNGSPPSQVTLSFATGTEHLSLWGPFVPSATFSGAAGRQIWSFFTFYSNAPRIRTVQRTILRQVNNSGPATIPNAQEVLLRLRIQNFNNLAGCAATLAAVLSRH
jgi:hypothetical protein